MELIIIAVLIVIASETTFLTVRSLSRQSTSRRQRMFVDTSVLIDGRIISLMKSGFVTDVVSIPRSVVGELQYLADHADNEKRARARHGLDVVKELQDMPGIEVEIYQDSNSASEGVDNRLLALAKRHGGKVCTIDYNLNKVAAVENIPVVNVNDLAMSLRMAYLPGERTIIDLTTKGNDSHQAVGHLQDGTMVVVEQANKYIGQSVEVEFIRSLQTSAGRMMFARLVDRSVSSQPSNSKSMKINDSDGRKADNRSQKKPSHPTQKSSPQRSAKPNDTKNQRYDKSREETPRQHRANDNRRKQQPRSRNQSERESDLINLVNNQ